MHPHIQKRQLNHHKPSTKTFTKQHEHSMQPHIQNSQAVKAATNHQLNSNNLSNAATHSKHSQSVKAAAECAQIIHKTAMQHLMQPHSPNGEPVTTHHGCPPTGENQGHRTQMSECIIKAFLSVTIGCSLVIHQPLLATHWQ